MIIARAVLASTDRNNDQNARRDRDNQGDDCVGQEVSFNRLQCSTLAPIWRYMINFSAPGRCSQTLPEPNQYQIHCRSK